MPTKMQEYLCGNGHRFTYLVHNREVPPMIVCPECFPAMHEQHVQALDAGGGEVVDHGSDHWAYSVSFLNGAWWNDEKVNGRFGTPVISAVLGKTIVRGNGDFADREKERLTKRMMEHNATKDSIEEQVETARSVIKKATSQAGA